MADHREAEAGEKAGPPLEAKAEAGEAALPDATPEVSASGGANASPTEAPPNTSPAKMAPDQRRRLIIAALIYAACVLVLALVAGKERLGEHTAFNHYAHLADSWIHGRQDLANGAPAYAQGNDFAVYGGKTYISFPPFPAVLMMPLVALAGSPEAFRDGQFMVWLAGLPPALLFLALEKLRRTKRSERSERDNIVLAFLFAFGTVYFFTAVEGTVWFAAHVVGAGLLAAYVLVALDGEHPALAGLLLGCAFATRPTTLLTAPLFAYEALRAAGGAAAFDADGDLGFLTRLKDALRRADKKRLLSLVVSFAVPILCVLAIASAMNYTRFKNPSPTAFGHEHLTVVWHGRIEKWGLFGLHYLPKNLGAMLSILPWPAPRNAPASAPPFVINEHGLALWFTTPLYLFLLWPKKRGPLHAALLLSVAGPLIMNLLYQNSGWRQFGYRFSNDYSVFLFVLLAIGGRPFGALWKALAVWSVGWNLFGAITFDRGGPYDRFYWREGSQQILYQPD